MNDHRPSSLESAASGPPLRPGQYLGSPLARHRGSGFSLTESVYADDARLPVHSHARAHFCLVVSGRYTEHLERGARLRQAGDLIFYPPESRHAEAHHTTGRHLMIEIGDELLARAAELGRLPARPSSCDRTAGWTAARLVESLRPSSSASPLVLEGLTIELLGRVVERESSETDTTPPPRWLLEALDVARAAMPTPPGLEALAEAAGVHPAHVSRTIRRCLDSSYGELVRGWRLELARQLLLDSDLPLSDVALESGYCDQSHLTRAFRQAVGTTPAALRRSHR